MGFLHDLLLEARSKQHEEDLKEAYGMGFHDGRLCPADLRPCLVGDKPALFHRWIDEDRALLKISEVTHPRDVVKFVSVFRDEAVIPNACSVETIRATYALVEYADGSVGRVDPKLVQFTDK